MLADVVAASAVVAAEAARKCRRFMMVAPGLRVGLLLIVALVGVAHFTIISPFMTIQWPGNVQR